MRQKLAALVLLSILLGAGCASIATLRMPDEFAQKKLKEDTPPDSGLVNDDLAIPGPTPKY